jgi:DNA-binding LacI/PurR family transcriptional regulator
MVTSEDVSTLAGVSRATVSHVINKTGYVSPELTRRVEAAIKQLNYRPDAIARSLAARRTLRLVFWSHVSQVRSILR